MIRTTIAALGLCAAITAPALADGHANKAIENAIKARQAQMQLYAFNLGQLGAMAKGDMEYNAEAAGAAASNLAALTKLNQMALWPQGSDSDSVEASRALPAITK